MKKGLLLLTMCTLFISISCKKKGCTDPVALNYQSAAEKDDGSCTYAPETTTPTGGVSLTADITTPTTLDSNTYTICTDIDVTSELTIMPGATFLMCAGASINVTVDGYINAVGSATKPIVIKGQTETPGYWQGIAIKSTNPNNVFSYVTVKDAGTYWAWEDAALFVTGSISMDHSTIANNVDIGMYVSGSIGNFASNTFSDNVTGLNLAVPQVSKLDGLTNYNDNNTNDFIYVRGGTIGTDQTWEKLSTDLLIQNLYMDAGLTINPGSRLRMEASEYGIVVESSGFLNCEGTASEPIFIGGKYSSAGYWAGLKIRSNNPNNVFNYVTIQDGGEYWAHEYANIYMNGGQLTIDNSTISKANSYGIALESNSQIITSGVVQTVPGGVEANNTFSANGTGANANCTSGCTVNFL